MGSNPTVSALEIADHVTLISIDLLSGIARSIGAAQRVTTLSRIASAGHCYATDSEIVIAARAHEKRLSGRWKP